MSWFFNLFRRRNPNKIEIAKTPQIDAAVECEFQDCADATLEELIEHRRHRKEEQLNSNAKIIAEWILHRFESDADAHRAKIARHCVGHVSMLRLTAKIDELKDCCPSTKLEQRVRKYLFSQNDRVATIVKTQQIVSCKVRIRDIWSHKVNMDVYFIFDREMFGGNALKTYPDHVFRFRCSLSREKRQKLFDDSSDDDVDSFDCGCVVHCKRCPQH